MFSEKVRSKDEFAEKLVKNGNEPFEPLQRGSALLGALKQNLKGKTFVTVI